MLKSWVQWPQKPRTLFNEKTNISRDSQERTTDGREKYPAGAGTKARRVSPATFRGLRL